MSRIFRLTTSYRECGLVVSRIKFDSPSWESVVTFSCLLSISRPCHDCPPPSSFTRFLDRLLGKQPTLPVIVIVTVHRHDTNQVVIVHWMICKKLVCSRANCTPRRARRFVCNYHKEILGLVVDIEFCRSNGRFFFLSFFFFSITVKPVASSRSFFVLFATLDIRFFVIVRLLIVSLTDPLDIVRTS